MENKSRITAAVLAILSPFSPSWKDAAEVYSNKASITDVVKDSLDSILPNITYKDGKMQFTIDMSGMNIPDTLHYSDLLAGETGFMSGPVTPSGIMTFSKVIEIDGINAATTAAAVIRNVKTHKSNIETLLENIKDSRGEKSPYQLKVGEHAEVDEKLKSGVTVTSKPEGIELG